MPITISNYIVISCHYSLELSFTSSIYISYVPIHNLLAYTYHTVLLTTKNCY